MNRELEGAPEDRPGGGGGLNGSEAHAAGRVHGRPGNPASHRWYVVDDPPAKASTGFEDLDGKKLIELRSTGAQTLVPPSLHPDLDQLRWEKDGEPARVEAGALLRSV